MLRELISIFRAGDPLEEMAQSFGKMLKIAEEMTLAGGDIFFNTDSAPEARTAVSKRDIKVNKLERRIRKQVVAHLSFRTNTNDLPFCLLLMSLVKDVERIGDHATNLAEARTYYSGELPSDDMINELGEIRREVESVLNVTSDVFAQSDREQAIDLIGDAKNIQRRCDELIVRIANSDYRADVATAVALTTRFYKRIVGHLHNVLSAVVMPIHKLDYYDEKELDRE